VSQSEPVTTFGPPVPELPVADVERAQQHYQDALGFKIGWLSGDIGAVSRVEGLDGNRFYFHCD
jgi:hypothetical protein